MTRLIDPVEVARAFRAELRAEIAALGTELTLVGFLSATDGPSRTYAEYTRKGCEDVGVRFSAQVPTHAVVVRADAGRLRQVLDGLAENALRVTPAGEQVVFAVTPNEKPRNSRA